MLIRIFHFLGLTNLSEEQIEKFCELKKTENLIDRIRNATSNQQEDLKIFLNNNLNLMDSAQLARGQLSKKDLKLVYVYAPDFLELHEEAVFQSTMDILKDKNRDVEFVFFVDKSNGQLRFRTLLKRITNESKDNANIVKQLRIVELEDQLFLTDYTLWNPFGPNPIGFQNLKRDGRTDLCVQMPLEQLNDVVTCLEHLREKHEITAEVIPIRKLGS